MSWYEFVVVVHVLSALIGIGPTFFGHVLLRRNQTVDEYRTSLSFSRRMELFPKIGGPIAVLSGLVLVLSGNYGPFAQLWMLGSLVLFVIIQIIGAVSVSPNVKKLLAWLNDPANRSIASFPPEQQVWVNRASNWIYASSALGTLLFVLMIWKPDL